MANPAKLMADLAVETRRGELYLGPAEVIEVRAGEVIVALPEGDEIAVEPALAFPYEPAPGDELLVIGKGDGRYYAIGVLHGTGRAALAIQGNVDLRAVGGKLHLAGDQGVEIEGPEIGIRAGKIRTIAESMVETVASLYQRVTAHLRVHARESHTLVEGSTITQAKAASITTEEVVTINGKQVHLG
ncbi:Hypothetical protein A7982_00616 [Minicystis rosea]|nr:Hypothetical protein A7982_00616 [Minicystis rosea]